MADAEVGSGIDPPVSLFIPNPSTLIVENSQEFNLCISTAKKDNTYKFKAHTFSNGFPEDILEWEKKMQKIVKCKLVVMAEGKFDLVEAILKGDALMHWLEFKQVEVTRTIKKHNGLDTAPLEMCNPTFVICLQELKKHYFPNSPSCLQKAYLCNHIKKPNKLSIKNTAARACHVNGMLAKFLVPGNSPMAKWSNMIVMMLSANREETLTT
eukprot:15365302-Ditylum_brightwellii.AAC.1